MNIIKDEPDYYIVNSKYIRDEIMCIGNKNEIEYGVKTILRMIQDKIIEKAKQGFCTISVGSHYDNDVIYDIFTKHVPNIGKIRKLVVETLEKSGYDVHQSHGYNYIKISWK